MKDFVFEEEHTSLPVVHVPSQEHNSKQHYVSLPLFVLTSCQDCNPSEIQECFGDNVPLSLDDLDQQP